MRPTRSTSPTARNSAGYEIATKAGRRQRARAQHVHRARQRRAARLRADGALQGAQRRAIRGAPGRDGLPGRTRSRSHAEACATRRRGLRHAKNWCSSAISSQRGSRTSPMRRNKTMRSAEASFRAIGGTADARRRRVLASARVRHRAARLFVLLHVLHRAARARPLRSPPDARDRRRSARHTSRAARARSCWSGRPSTPGAIPRPAPISAISASRSPHSGARAPDVHLAASQGFYRKDHRGSGATCRSSIRACICRCNRAATRCCAG